jgi:hypothetical protein
MGTERTGRLTVGRKINLNINLRERVYRAAVRQRQSLLVPLLRLSDVGMIYRDNKAIAKVSFLLIKTKESMLQMKERKKRGRNTERKKRQSKGKRMLAINPVSSVILPVS